MKKKGFTLIEILAVIVILGLILVIAVPKIVGIIESAKRSTFINSANTIAILAERRLSENELLGNNNNNITCEKIASLTADNYKSCSIEVIDGDVYLTLIGKGKFENMSICEKTRNNMQITEACISELIIDLNGGSMANNPAGTRKVGESIILEDPTKEGYEFDKWSLVSGDGELDLVNKTILMNKENTEIKANWTPITYTIVYNCNGGTGSTASSAHTYGVEKQLTSNSCIGTITAGTSGVIYAFDGWVDASDPSKTYENNQNGSNMIVNNGTIITLNAKWTPLFTITGNYEVINDSNGNWRVKILGSAGQTSGKAIIKFSKFTPVDVFLVGGGASGCAKSCGRAAAPGGGGGTTLTFSTTIEPNVAETIIVGAGGISIRGGCTTPYVYGNIGGTTSAFNKSAAGGSSPRGTVQTNQEFGEANGIYYAGDGGNAWDYYAGGFNNWGDTTGGTGGGAGSNGYNYYAGTANTGGGGGAGVYNSSGSGGSGIVVIRNHR